MLTVRQLLVASGQNSRAIMHTNALRQQFPALGQSFSLAKVIAAFEKQRRVYFVSLVSPRIFLSNDVQTFEDLVRLSPDFHGQMEQSEVLAFSASLEKNGVLLRLVDKNFRRAAIVGTVPALASVPGIVVNGQNFIAIKNYFSGAEAIGGAAIAVGAVLISMSGVPEPASPVLFAIGAVLVGAGTGFTITTGVLDIMNDDHPVPVKPSPDNTKSEVDTPDGGDQDTIELPNAVAIGDPPNGLDADGLVAKVGDFALDLVLSDIPIGWDSDAGEGLPGLGAGDLTGGGDGDGGIIGGFPV